jgi:hypothetical protein
LAGKYGIPGCSAEQGMKEVSLDVEQGMEVAVDAKQGVELAVYAEQGMEELEGDNEMQSSRSLASMWIAAQPRREARRSSSSFRRR